MQALETLEDFYAAIEPNEGFTNHYTLTNVKEFKMHHGIAWTADLNVKGVKVADVECDGNGGCYSYHFTDPKERTFFKLAVKLAYVGRDMVDVEEDCFINWIDKDNLR